MVGMGAMARLQTNTLILTTNTVAVRQWIDELLDKTTLDSPESASIAAIARRSSRSPSAPTQV